MLTLSWMSPGAEFVYAVGAGSAPQNLPNIEGGYLSDFVAGLAVDAQGNVYMAGTTYSPVFPTDTPINCCTLNHPYSSFVAKLSPDGSRFAYVRVFPGGRAAALAVDGEGNAYVAGNGNPSPSGGPFVLKLDPSGSQTLYLADLRSYLDQATGLALDGAGNA